MYIYIYIYIYIYMCVCVCVCVCVYVCVERRRDNLRGVNNFHLKAKAGIWPRLSSMC